MYSKLIARFWNENLAISYINFISSDLDTDIFGMLYDEVLAYLILPTS